MSFKFNTIHVDQGTTTTLEEGEQIIEDTMDSLKELVCGADVLTAQVTVTTLTAAGVRHHEVTVDNENAQMLKTSLKANGDIVESSELYRQVTNQAGTATMCDGDTLTLWLGSVEDENILLLTAPEVREVMDCSLIKF